MGFNYFLNIENLYKNQFNKSKPLVIRFDAVGITKNGYIDIINESENSFSDALKKTCKELSDKYYCLAFAYTDEINLVLEPKTIELMYRTNDIQKVNSLISQEIFEIFNKNIRNNDDVKIKFDCRLFSIPKNKVKSYIKYRIKSGQNVVTVYFAKRYFDINTANIKKIELEKELSEFEIFENRTLYQRQGLLCFDGKVIDENYLDFIEKIDNNIDNSLFYNKIKNYFNEEEDLI